MKIAILLSGRMRTFWHNYKNILENLIVPNDADVFIFAGGDQRFNDDRWTGLYPYCSTLKSRGGDSIENIIDLDERQYFTDKLGSYLKKFVYLEEDPSFKTDFSEILGQKTHGHGYIVEAYLRQKKCNELRKQYELEQGLKYDAIVRLRSDMVFSFKLDLQNYDFSGNNLFVGSSHPPYGQGDAFYFGSPAIMDVISSKFTHEYGTFGSNQSDLMDFHSFLNKYNANRIVYNANKMSFCERMDYSRETRATRNSWRTPTQCSCCFDAGPGIGGISIPIIYDNEIAKQYNLTELRVFVL